MSTETRFWTASAYVEGTWRDDVELVVGRDGCWSSVRAGVARTADVVDLGGPVVPPLVDAHSHAFQRAMAGFAERRAVGEDDFWSWRDRMYGIALRVAPDVLRAIAGQLYAELLRGGYTHVVEFHYLRHAPDGTPYPEPLALANALGEAAADAGIGLTLLPVLYVRGGFGTPLRMDQRRFRLDADGVWADARAFAARSQPLQRAGVAVHSVRAAAQEDIERLLANVGDADVPIHVHAAEQVREVDDCLAATGRRPIDWLCRTFPVDARWHLVHATHATPEEIATVAGCGAGIVLCPGTEANLGDGLPDLGGWLSAGVPWSIGSDSQVTRAWPEELRWLEYGQRLALRRRNVAADPPRAPSTAARLFEAARRGGAAAAGFASWGLVAGARADFLVLDAVADALLGVPPDFALDALVFSASGNAIRDVYVAGRQVVRGGVHPAGQRIADRFAQAMAGLAAG
jgi:formimidoylglutamate deiminase